MSNRKSLAYIESKKFTCWTQSSKKLAFSLFFLHFEVNLLYAGLVVSEKEMQHLPSCLFSPLYPKVMVLFNTINFPHHPSKPDISSERDDKYSFFFLFEKALRVLLVKSIFNRFLDDRFNRVSKNWFLFLQFSEICFPLIDQSCWNRKFDPWLLATFFVQNSVLNNFHLNFFFFFFLK